jgi:hypothetical protein
MSLAGCSSADRSWNGPGLWTAPGSNDANLRTMIVNPADLANGQAAATSRGPAAATPVGRLLTDKRYPLPTQNTTSTLQMQIGVSPNASGQ